MSKSESTFLTHHELFINTNDVIGSSDNKPSENSSPSLELLLCFLMATSKNSDETKNEKLVDQKPYLKNVLDDVVGFNSFFTVAVFLGLTFAQPGQVDTLHDDLSCNPGTNMRKRIVAYEMLSFSFFVFSSITAQSVKVFLYTSEYARTEEKMKKGYQSWMCDGGLYLSIYGTMLGCLLLLLAMVDVVQIKLGLLSCHSKTMLVTVSVMVSIIGLSLLIYFFTVTNSLRIAVQEMIKKKEKIGPMP